LQQSASEEATPAARPYRMVSTADESDNGLSSSEFSAHLACLFDILADGQSTVSTPSLIRYWQLSDYAVSFALIDAFQKYSDYDNRLGFEQFSQAVGHCLATCEPYATASGSAQQLAEPAVASESGYRTFDSRSLEPSQPPKPAPHRGPPLRVYSDSGVLDQEFDGRPRPLRPPDYDTYMNNSLDCGIGGVGVGAIDGVGVRRAARSKPPVPLRTTTAARVCSAPTSPAPLPPSTDGDAVGPDGPDADEYETLISQPAARGPPPPPPPPPRPSSLLPAKPQQPPPPPASAQERHRQRARSPMKRLVQAFTRPLSRSQSFRISRPSVTTEPVSSAQPQPPTAASSSAALPAKQQQQQQSKPHQSLAKFASFVENPDRFSGSYHARGALLRERLRCVRQAYECVEACRQSLVAQIADLQSQLAGCPGSFDDANGSGGPASVAASSSSLPSTAMLRAVLPCIGDANGATASRQPQRLAACWLIRRRESSSWRGRSRNCCGPCCRLRL
ncbi:hypothetical protein BOX15_Mlig027502g1, partial [Macrostomum lignano]